MSRTGHRGESTAPPRLIERLNGERPDPLAPREDEGSFAGFRFILRQGGFGIVRIDAGGAEVSLDTPPAIAPPSQRGGALFRKLAVIDIAKTCHFLYQLGDRRLPLPVPAALVNLAFKVARQSGPRGGVALDIAQRQRTQRLGMKPRDVAI